MKRALVPGVLLVAVLATGAAPASAKIARGTFAGTTSAADPVGFKVNRRGRVVSFHYDAVTLNCTDGDSFDTPTGDDRVETPARVSFRVTRTNKFGIRARNDETGFGWDAKGTFKNRGRRATGTLKIFATFDENNQQDPNGSVRCESETLRWSASRRRARR